MELDIICSDGQTQLLPWVKNNLADLQSRMKNNGLLHLRGFVSDTQDLANFVGCFDDTLLEDAFWSTPRTSVSDKTFTATEYDANKTISLHSEMSYARSWPRIIAFQSIKTAAVGGQTTLGDLVTITARLGELLKPFTQKGVEYRRTYHPGIDIPWQRAFQCDNKEQVEYIASKKGMKFKWLDNDTFQTSQVVQGTVLGFDKKPLWFNQAHIFHAANLPEVTLTSLISYFGEENLPRHAFYGDGTPIPHEVIHKIKAVLTEQEYPVNWQDGDYLLVDNLRFAHGRRPFQGTRTVHVAMASPESNEQIMPIQFSQNIR